MHASTSVRPAVVRTVPLAGGYLMAVPPHLISPTPQSSVTVLAASTSRSGSSAARSHGPESVPTPARRAACLRARRCSCASPSHKQEHRKDQGIIKSPPLDSHRHRHHYPSQQQRRRRRRRDEWHRRTQSAPQVPPAASPLPALVLLLQGPLSGGQRQGQGQGERKRRRQETCEGESPDVCARLFNAKGSSTYPCPNPRCTPPSCQQARRARACRLGLRRCHSSAKPASGHGHATARPGPGPGPRPPDVRATTTRRTSDEVSAPAHRYHVRPPHSFSYSLLLSSPNHILARHDPTLTLSHYSGGGIGGLALATFLNLSSRSSSSHSSHSTSAADLAIDIYEAAPSLTELGAGVGMWLRTWRIMQAFSSPVPSSSSSSPSSSCERDGEQTDTDRDGADADGEKGEKGELEEKAEKEETLVAGLARIAPAGRDMGNALRTSCF